LTGRTGGRRRVGAQGSTGRLHRFDLLCELIEAPVDTIDPIRRRDVPAPKFHTEPCCLCGKDAEEVSHSISVGPMSTHGDYPAGLLDLPATVAKADERRASLDLSGGER